LARLALYGVALAALTGVLAAPWSPAAAEDAPGASHAPRYAFLVGASSYLYGSQVGLADLKYADDDALAFGEALVELGWPAANVDVVVQGEAGSGVRSRIVAPPTRQGILERWRAFRERVIADAERTGVKAEGVVLLLSGHGVEFKGQPKGELKVENTYFVPVNAQRMEADSLVDVQAMLEELQQLPVNRRWFVYDACRKSVEAVSRDYAPSSTMLQRLRVPQGTWLLLSCESGQASYEARQLGHGVFLHHLVQGMRGEQAVNSEGELTLTSLADYAASATRRWVRDNLAGEEQLPVLKSEGTTWVLAERSRSARPTPAPAPATPTPEKPRPDEPPVELPPGVPPEDVPISKEAVNKALADLDKTEPEILYPAITVVQKYKVLEAVPKLLKILGAHEDTFTRQAAAAALGEMRACDAVEALAEGLLDKSVMVSTQASKALRLITDHDLGITTQARIQERRRARTEMLEWWQRHEEEVRTRWKQPKALPSRPSR
jgi:hypothetical protein